MEVVVDSGTAGAERELLVDTVTDAPVTLRTVLGALELDPGAAVAVDGTPTDVDLPFEVAVGRSGATITLDGDEGGLSEHRATTALALLSGPSAGRCLPLSGRAVVLGRSRRAGIVVDDPTVSGLHARLVVAADGTCTVADLHSTNGTRVNGVFLVGPTVVTVDDVVTFGAMHAALRTVPTNDAAPVTTPSTSGRVPFFRPPRPAIPSSPNAVPVPTAPAASSVDPRFGWAAVIAPLVLGLVMAMLFGPMMAAFAIFSPVMVIGNWWEERRRTPSRQR